MSLKSKRQFVALKSKLEVLKKLNKGETIKNQVTVDDWHRNCDKIEIFSSEK